MTEHEVDDITRELARFGHAAVTTFQQWRRFNPQATRVPSWLHREMTRQMKQHRREIKRQWKADLREQGEQRRTDRRAFYNHLDRQFERHQENSLALHHSPSASPEQYARAQWELATRRQELAQQINSAPWLTREERGQAYKALDAAHFAGTRGVQKWEPWNERRPLAGVAALKARAADRLARIRHGFLERGRTGVRGRADRPAQFTPEERLEEVRRLIGVRQYTQVTGRVFEDRLWNERGQRLHDYDPDLLQRHLRTLSELDTRINQAIESSGLTYDQWRQVRADMAAEPSHAMVRHAERAGRWELERVFRTDAEPGTADEIADTPWMGRFWAHEESPDCERALLQELEAPPADWQPYAPDSDDRFVTVLNSGDPTGLHVQTFRTATEAYDWAQHKLPWITADERTTVAVVVWDRSVPLGADGDTHPSSIDKLHGSLAEVDRELDRRYGFERDRARFERGGAADLTRATLAGPDEPRIDRGQMHVPGGARAGQESAADLQPQLSAVRAERDQLRHQLEDVLSMPEVIAAFERQEAATRPSRQAGNGHAAPRPPAPDGQEEIVCAVDSLAWDEYMHDPVRSPLPPRATGPMATTANPDMPESATAPSERGISELDRLAEENRNLRGELARALDERDDLLRGRDDLLIDRGSVASHDHDGSAPAAPDVPAMETVPSTNGITGLEWGGFDR
ncbi:hypothetical protein [Nocardia wallacei]|uniref:hypothetical protein n=1 Tax=Nocardia wallacei TaxID=480035 RepID=UPI002455D995|nr:hypothetical protein [Nocardia wallacei]